MSELKKKITAQINSKLDTAEGNEDIALETIQKETNKKK